MKETLFAEFSKSREGARLLNFARTVDISIKFDSQLEPGNAHFRPESWHIALPDKAPLPHMIISLAHELRHVQQHAAGLIPELSVKGHGADYDLLHPQRYMALFRICEADASAFQTLFARQHARETGQREVAHMAQTWPFARASAPNNAPARQMLDAAASFLADETYWKHYRAQYLLQIGRIQDFLVKAPVLALEFMPCADVTPDDIKKFSRLESNLDGVTGYLDGASPAFLKNNGFLRLPDKINGGVDTDILRVTDIYQQLRAVNATRMTPASNPKIRPPGV